MLFWVYNHIVAWTLGCFIVAYFIGYAHANAHHESSEERLREAVKQMRREFEEGLKTDE